MSDQVLTRDAPGGEAAPAASLDAATVQLRLSKLLGSDVRKLVRYPSGFSWIT